MDNRASITNVDITGSNFNLMNATLQFPVQQLLVLGVNILEITSEASLSGIKDYVGRVYVDGNFRGSCFFYRVGYALTDAHVVTGQNILIKNNRDASTHATVRFQQGHRGCFPDLAILQLAQPLSDADPSCSMNVKTGDTSYIVGYHDDTSLRIDKGMTSVKNIFQSEYFTTSAFADQSFSGCPCVNARGHIIGMVHGEEGQEKKCLPLMPIGFLLAQNDLPAMRLC